MKESVYRSYDALPLFLNYALSQSRSVILQHL